MTLKPLATILFTVALIPRQAEAQEPLTFSMEEAINFAVAHSYSIQQAKYDLDVSKRKVKETTAIGLPQINGEASFNDYIDIPVQVAPADAFALPDDFMQYLAALGQATGVPFEQSGGGGSDDVQEFQFGQKYTVSAGLTASQLLFDGSYFVGLKAAKEFVRQSELGIVRSEIEVKNSVAQTYISALAAQENIKALKENKANIERIYKETSALYETGFLEKQDADQMRLLQSNIRNQLDYAQRQEQNILNLLKFQMGVPIKDSISLSDNIESLVALQTEASLSLLEQPFTPSNHIDFQTIEQGEKLQALSISNERARYYPQMNAFFTHSQNAYRNEFDFFSGGSWYPTTLWGLQLRVPIFSSLQGRQRVAQAKIELAKVQNQKIQLEESLNMQVMSAKMNYSSALERYETVRGDLELAKSIKERTRVKYNEGLASSTDLTAMENQYLTSLGNYINTTMELLNSKIALDRALGQL